jgi:hypothetical protein
MTILLLLAIKSFCFFNMSFEHIFRNCYNNTIYIYIYIYIYTLPTAVLNLSYLALSFLFPWHFFHSNHCLSSTIQWPCGKIHCCIKSTLRARCSSHDWVSHLPYFFLSYSIPPHDLTNLSPVEAVFGTPLILPAQFPTSPYDDSSHFLTQLHTLSSSLTPSSPSSTWPPEIPSPLLNSSFLFLFYHHLPILL